MTSIRLHKKHGVNPMLTNCFWCGESMGVALMGLMNTKTKAALREAGASASSDGAAPRQGVVLDKAPCSKCEAHMEEGVILISVDEEKSDDMENPYRTGAWVVVSDKFINRVLDEQTAEHIIKFRRAFVPDDAWDMLGLPRGEAP